MSSANLTMTDQQFERLRRVIYERSGIHFQNNRKYVLESRLARRLEELAFDNFDQYLMFLTVGPYQTDEFQEMFNRITINETSFFRNEPQHEVFETKVLPALIQARQRSRTLRIWSAACSTGEEPYTLAIQVYRTLGVRLAEWKVEILGTDISEKVLRVAQTARYTSYSIRTLPPILLSRYFRETAGFHQLDPQIQKMVRFELLNLKDAAAARRFGVFDVIFCRNVMIYFDDAMRARCAQLFYNQLAADGTLFIGHSETLRNVSVPFQPMAMPQAFGYTRAIPTAGREVARVA
jgi:chemotaxis protein methyltransferase CheR